MEPFVYMLTICLCLEILILRKLFYRNFAKNFKSVQKIRMMLLFVSQRLRWYEDKKNGPYIDVAQTVAIEELSEIKFDKSLKDEVHPSMHTAYRSVLGQINWLQSRTQFHICCKFSRCASRAAAPTIGDVRAIIKIVRTIRAQSLSMKFWPLQGPCRILGFPDASYRNNENKSSQRAHTIFLAEERDLKHGKSWTRGSLVDYESHKIIQQQLCQPLLPSCTVL